MNVNEVQVLKCIHQRLPMRRIAVNIGKSIGVVQRICKILEDGGYIDNPYNGNGSRQAAVRILTEKGRDLLKKERLLKTESYE